jgi:tripartite-type tricarboxylate transporter receptor subunit TctC
VSRLFVLLFFVALHAAAQTHFPTKPVRIVIGVPPGGQADTLVRGNGRELSAKWSQPVLVENRPGASGVIATESVVKSAADGHSIFSTDSVQFITNSLVRKNLPYDPIKDLTPLAMVAGTSSLLVVNAKSPVTNTAQLIEHAKANPGKLNYGSFGIGSSLHLAAEALAATTGFRAVHVPYKGGPEIVNGLLAGDIDFAFVGTSTVLPMVKQGRLRALASANRERMKSLQDLPTVGETVSGFDNQGWYGWFVPSATPKPVVDRLAGDIGEVLARPDISEKLIARIGLEPIFLAPGAFAAQFTADRDKFRKLIDRLDLKLE